ncbi:MAG: glycoside hydrolase family 127 protein, partial [Massilibacteroides sp.]|nr:glycoside hydrolase family 127 protein [Massilibacteroides sp.]
YYAGATDLYAETGEQALIEALDRLWNSVTEKKMYITGACGQTHHGMSSHQDAIHEGFIDNYMMPNLTAYNETCANICNAMFSYRMLGIHGEAKYADIMELVMFNSALSGISVDGKNYFYANPLRMINGARDYKSTESAVREPYLDCFCCPPNLVRTIAKLSGWAYSLTENGLAVNMYGGNHLKTQLLNGEEIELNQESQYPWDGAVKISVEKCQKKPFAIALRIPGWAEGSTITINGEKYLTPIVADTYVQLDRKWKKGDVINFIMPMKVKREEGHPRIEEVRNQVAIQRGPVIYCAETPDLPQGTSILDVYLPYSSTLTPVYKKNLLGGLTVINGDVRIRLDNKSTRMYHPLVKPQWKTATIQFVPYYSWCNRGKSEMTVWFPVIWD